MRVIKLKDKFFEKTIKNPIIAEVNCEKKLYKALDSPCENIFLLSGDIINIEKIVKKAKLEDKGVYVHIDLIEGISKDIWGLRFIIKNVNPDGIITTKANIVKWAKDLNLFTIQRLFILDSMSLETGIRSVLNVKPDAIEMLPGIMPPVVKIISSRTKLPIITGGFIREKEDVMDSLVAGAIGVSTSNENVWYM